MKTIRTHFLKTKTLFLTIGFFSVLLGKSIAQEIPFSEIPTYPETYTPGNVVARMIDGLGYRYYWGTEGLTEKDLAHRASQDGRSIMETMEHIRDLSEVIFNAASGNPNTRPGKDSIPFEALRRATLDFLLKARNHYEEKDLAAMEASKIIFEGEKGTVAFPFWHVLNGPLADALWHTGQIVMLRRAAGNPISSKVNVFTGKNRE